MRSADKNCLGGDAAFLVDRFTDGFHQGPTNGQGVDAHQGHATLAVVEDRRPDLARIVQGAVESLAISAGLLHADVGRDVALGKADFRQRLRRGRRSVGRTKAQDNRRGNCCDQEAKTTSSHRWDLLR